MYRSTQPFRTLSAFSGLVTYSLPGTFCCHVPDHTSGNLPSRIYIMMSPGSFLYARRPWPLSNTLPTPQPSTTTTLSNSPTTGRRQSVSTLFFEPVSSQDDCSSNYAEHTFDGQCNITTQSKTPVATDSWISMGIKMGWRETTKAPSRPALQNIQNVTALPNASAKPSSPVQIPKQRQNDGLRYQKRSSAQRRPLTKDSHTPGSLSPSLAALLVGTNIPRQRSPRHPRKSSSPTIIDEDVEPLPVSEKEMSWGIGRGPLDMLLSPPEDILDDDISISDDTIGSALSTRTISADSIPSLGGSFGTDGGLSLETPRSPSPSRRRRAGSLRKLVQEPIRSPPGTADDHPLASSGDLDFDELDLKPAQIEQIINETEKTYLALPFKPLKSVFKSNLTASLRALRSAAKSFSSLNFPIASPEDFVARSMLTMDPNVPYTDERRPPVTQELPSAELRRYLNPTSRQRGEYQSNDTMTSGAFSASIQMQTYKIHKAHSPTPPNTTSVSSSPAVRTSTADPQSIAPKRPNPPMMRQREVRENPDFIRVAVMEMAMRKRGKLDDQRPGRARWALPARKPTTRPYQIGQDGIPARWVPISY